MFNEDELLRKYIANYNLKENLDISFEQVLFHFELEKQLTQRLINSSKFDRTEIFIQCYTELYEKVYWLNKKDDAKDENENIINNQLFVDLLEKPPKKIYEIGSGKAELLSFLAKLGYDCKGTEITTERGRIFSNEVNINWGFTDGVNLDKYEELEYYDYIISNQVIEHLHPDDLFDHFNSAKAILKHGGKYIFNTPHRFTGPHDISRVFGCRYAVGMHLKEYTFNETYKLLKKIGFNNISTPNYAKYIRKITTNKKTELLISIWLLKIILLLEKIPWLIPKLLHKKLFNSVFLVAVK